MKKTIFIIFCFFSLFSLFAKVGDTMYVSVNSADSNATASIGGKVTGTVYDGDIVRVLAEKGKWTQFELKGTNSVSGWIKPSSLTKKKIVPTGNKVSANE